MNGALGVMTREHALAYLRGVGVEVPERFADQLPDEALFGVIRYHRHETSHGKKIGSGLIVNWMKAGGFPDFGKTPDAPGGWARTWQGRERWMDEHVPDLDPEYAETAIISLTQQKKNPSPETVRACAELLEQDQLAHDEKCRKAVEGQRSLAGREETGTREGRAGGGSPAFASTSRPASEQKPAQLVREAQASQKKEDTTSQLVGGRDRRGT